MVYGLWDVVAHDGLVIWACAMLAVLALRAGSYWLYRRRAEPHATSILWTAAFTIGSGLAGALWGAAGVFLFPSDALEYQLFILFILMGMGAGAISSLTAYMPAFYAFLPISLLPISVMLFREGESIHMALAIMTIAYALLALRHGIFDVVLPIFVLHSLLLPLNLRRMKEQHSIKFEHDRTIGLAAGSRRDAHYAYRGVERVLDKRDHARA
jgi:hypothetical protein